MSLQYNDELAVPCQDTARIIPGKTWKGAVGESEYCGGVGQVDAADSCIEVYVYMHRPSSLSLYIYIHTLCQRMQEMRWAAMCIALRGLAHCVAYIKAHRLGQR